jgi:DNA-binding NarL/FixJ family response regulator
MPDRAYRILIVDDHPVVRRGLRTLLESQPGIEVCSEASSGAEAMGRAREHKPDLVMLDLTMPGMHGLDVARALRRELPTTEILVLTMHFSEELARDVLRAGALGYVLKSEADEELLAAIDHARHRQPFFTGKLASTMARDFLRGSGYGSREGASGQGEPPESSLTPREIEVVRRLANGGSNKEIAAALGVSTRTIESHRHHIMHKMNFGAVSELVRFAVRNGLVDT